MPRSVTLPTATTEQCARLDAFARALGLELEDLLPPDPAGRVTASTTLTIDELRALDLAASRAGTTRGVILRGLALSLTRGHWGPQDGRQA